jgi:transcriptional regulator with XRE-family HTH domain
MNAVRAVRLAKGLLKKDVLERAGGVLTPHRLNQIEAGRGWRPRADEKTVLAGILEIPAGELFPAE